MDRFERFFVGLQQLIAEVRETAGESRTEPAPEHEEPLVVGAAGDRAALRHELEDKRARLLALQEELLRLEASLGAADRKLDPIVENYSNRRCAFEKRLEIQENTAREKRADLEERLDSEESRALEDAMEEIEGHITQLKARRESEHRLRDELRHELEARRTKLAKKDEEISDAEQTATRIKELLDQRDEILAKAGFAEKRCKPGEVYVYLFWELPEVELLSVAEFDRKLRQLHRERRDLAFGVESLESTLKKSERRILELEDEGHHWETQRLTRRLEAAERVIEKE